MSKELLKVRSVSKTYGFGDSAVQALIDIDLSISAGECLFCVGPSGSGKTTLLHIIGGIEGPSGGAVYFQGEDIYRLGDKKSALFRNRQIGFIFQQFHLLAELTVSENVALPARIAGCTPRKADRMAGALLALAGLEDKRDAYPAELSGGQLQRTAIARALINDPELILCDEPTGSLDSETGSDIIRMLMSYKQKKNKALFIVTHDINLLRAEGTVVHLKDGHIARA